MMAVTVTGASPRITSPATLAATWTQVTVPSWVRTVAVLKRAATYELYLADRQSTATDGGAVGAAQGRVTSLTGSPGIVDHVLSRGPGRAPAADRVFFLAASVGTPVVDIICEGADR